MREQTIWRCLAVGAAIGLTSGAWGQQAVSFAPILTQGHEFTYEIDMRLGVRQTTGDAPAKEAKTASVATVRFTVKEITEAGSAQVEMTVEAMRLDNEIEGEASGYGWPSEADPLEDALAILGEILASETIELNIASSGEVTLVSGLDGFVEAAVEIAGSKSHLLLGLFNPDTLGASLTPLFAIDGARAAERTIHDQWESVRQAPMAPIGVMSLASSFTFTTFDDGIAGYSGTTIFSIDTPDGDQNAGPTIEVVEQTGETKGAFDTNIGLLRTRSRVMSVRTRWSLGDLVMEQMQDSTLRFTLIDQE